MKDMLQGFANMIFATATTVEVHVAKPWCTPARDRILTTLRPYRVIVHGVREKVVYLGEHPLHIEAWVRVNPQAAEWTEYLLARAGFKLMAPINPDNVIYASWHDDMPTPWERRMGKAVQIAEPECTMLTSTEPTEVQLRDYERRQQRRRRRVR